MYRELFIAMNTCGGKLSQQKSSSLFEGVEISCYNQLTNEGIRSLWWCNVMNNVPGSCRISCWLVKLYRVHSTVSNPPIPPFILKSLLGRILLFWEHRPFLYLVAGGGGCKHCILMLLCQCLRAIQSPPQILPLRWPPLPKYCRWFSSPEYVFYWLYSYNSLYRRFPIPPLNFVSP